MWVVGWWNRIHCLVDTPVAILDGLILRILKCKKVHSPTRRSYTLATPPTSKQALYYSARLDVGGDVIMTLLLVGLCTLSTPGVIFKYLLFLTVRIHVILTAWRALFYKRYPGTLSVPRNSGVCQYQLLNLLIWL